MTVVNNASVIFKDKNGNVGKVKAPSANDITKISTAISDVAQVVDPTSHLPINATTSSVGVVQLADSAAVAAGTSGRVVDAAQLKDAIEHVTPAGNLMTTDTAQTVTAVKTFSSLPESSVVPTSANQLVNKQYVDDHATPTPTNMMTTDTAQTVSAVKTFSTLPESSVAPTTANQLVNKTYADTKADIEVASTYAEPAVDNGILSPATDMLTAPSTAQELAIPQSHFPGELIISTVPITDANVHLADGALLDGAGSYADFVEIMGAKVATNPELFVTESDWQTSVTNTGSCGKFVYDSVNNTLRLPKYDARYLKSTLSASDLGDLVEAGVPNLKGYSTAPDYPSVDGILFQNEGGISSQGSQGGTTDTKISFDASRYNSIYKDSATTIDTDAVKVYYYIVLGTVSKTQIQIDIDNVMADLANKADKDFSNVSAPVQSFKNMSVGWGMPDFSRQIDITSSISTTNASITVDQDSYILFTQNINVSSYRTIFIDDVPLLFTSTAVNSAKSGTIVSITKGTHLIRISNPMNANSLVAIVPCAGV